MKKIILFTILLIILTATMISASDVVPPDIYKIESEDKAKIKEYLQQKNPDKTIEVIGVNKEYVSDTHKITDVTIDGKEYKWITKKSNYDNIKKSISIN